MKTAGGSRQQDQSGNLGLSKGWPMTEPTQTCANCDRKIGRLEKPYAWQGHTVCLECYERLGRAAKNWMVVSSTLSRLVT